MKTILYYFLRTIYRVGKFLIPESARKPLVLFLAKIGIDFWSFHEKVVQKRVRRYKESQFIHNDEYLLNFKLFSEVKELPKNYRTCFLEPEICKGAYLDEPLARRPIDVFFVGFLTQRREDFFIKAAPALSKYLCYLHFVDALDPPSSEKNTYMDITTIAGLMQRSKIILNIHKDKNNCFDWQQLVRQGIGQRALVISEPISVTFPFQPGVDFVEASLEEIPDKIKYYLFTSQGQKEAQAIASQGFKALTTSVQYERNL